MGSTSTLSLAGYFPRVGPGRALWIALRSRFRKPPNSLSVRKSEVNEIRDFLSTPREQGYFVVTGDKGVGKSCLVATALSKTAGVVPVAVSPGQSNDIIIENSLRALTNVHWPLGSFATSARRVIFCYHLLTWGKSPIIILNVGERGLGGTYAGVTNAARRLVEDFNLQVIVDGSPNSIEGMLLSTKRQRVLLIQPFGRDVLWGLPQLQPLFKVLKDAELEDVAWAVLDGVPIDYVALWELFASKSKDVADKNKLLGELLCDIVHTKAQELNKDKGIDRLIALYKKDVQKYGGIYTPEDLPQDLKRPEPDKIFRTRRVAGRLVLVPATNLIKVALHYTFLDRPPTVEELRVWVKEEMKK